MGYALLIAVLVGPGHGRSETSGASPEQAELRRPVAVVLSPDEQRVFLANQRSGSISVVDLRTASVEAEWPVGGQLSDLVERPHGRQLLACDQQRHELLILDVDEATISVRQRLPVSPYPVSVVVGRDGRQCFVASLWSRRVSCVELPTDEGEPARVVARLDLTIAPRQQLLIEDEQRLIVADSFGGQIYVIDTPTMTLTGQRQFAAHNIRGLDVTRNGKMLVIAHQMLNELAHTVRNDVHWGLLMSNDLRWFQLDAVLDPQRDLYTGAHMHPLGEAGNAAGDPAEVVLADDGKFVVALSGVAEIAVGREREFGLQRIKVGLGPVALAVNRQSDRAYVANRLSDSLSIVDLVQRQVVATVPLGPKVKLSPADRGEQLFFSAELSHDGWMSCHSCHTDGHTNGLLNDNLSDGAFGAPKRVLSLLGREGTEPFAWDGSSDQLEAQIRKSIVNTMQSDLEPSDKQVSAIAAYVRTLSSPPSLDRLRGTQDEEAVRRGQEVFQRQQCGRCHAPPSYTTSRLYDVGLEDKKGGQRFNPPSLLGVGQRGPYFHDNRAKTLEDVFTEWEHPNRQPLEPGDRQALLSFLRSL